MGKLIFSIFLVLIIGITINLLIPEHFIIKNVMFILLCIIAFYMVKNMDSKKVKKIIFYAICGGIIGFLIFLIPVNPIMKSIIFFLAFTSLTCIIRIKNRD